MEAKYQRFLPIEEKNKRSLLAKSVERSNESGNSGTPCEYESFLRVKLRSRSNISLLNFASSIFRVPSIFFSRSSPNFTSNLSKEPTNKRYEIARFASKFNYISYRCKNSNSNIKFDQIDDISINILSICVYIYVRSEMYKNVT